MLHLVNNREEWRPEVGELNVPKIVLSEDFWAVAEMKLENARNFRAQEIETLQQFKEGKWRLDESRRPFGHNQSGIRQRDISSDLDQLPYYIEQLNKIFDRFEELFDAREVTEEFIELYGEICECVGFLTDRYLDDSDEFSASRRVNAKPVEDHLTWYCKAVVAQMALGKSITAAREEVRKSIANRSAAQSGKFGGNWFEQFYTDSGDIRRIFSNLPEPDIRDRALDRFADIPDI